MSFRTQAPNITRFTFGTGKVDDKSNAEHYGRDARRDGGWRLVSHSCRVWRRPGF